MSKKYKVNERFFDTWSPEMAYVLGFWTADGYMRHERSYRIVFSSADYDLLSQIKEVMMSTHPICTRKKPSKKAKKLEHHFIIFSKALYSQLEKLGGKRRKSRSTEFPSIPQKYFSDFVRGYFDGDGSVFYTNYISTKNRKPRTELRSNFTSGNPLFLEKLQKILVDSVGVSRKKICPFNKGASWRLGYATGDTAKLLKFMYHPSYTIGLKRKAGFAEDILNGQRFICRGMGMKFARVLER